MIIGVRLKKILPLLIIVFVFVNTYGQVKSELRGVWLTNVDSNVLNSDQNISDAMNYLASIGINVVFPVVYNKGYTLYPSKVMQDLFNTPVLPNSSFVNRDFLKRLIIEAHRNGIEVIPWFEFGFSTSYSDNGGHIIAKFPDWALKDNTGKLVVKNGFDWMSAINPDAQNFMLSLMTEVMDNYDVDGVQGDDRLPAMPVEGGYDSVTVSIYKSEHSGQTPPTDYTNAAWMKWRADKLTQFLSRLHDSVKVRSKNLILSTSPTPYSWGYREYLQDSKTWVQQGLIDNVIPQLYQYDISNFNYALNTNWNNVGQYIPDNYSPGILAKIGSYVVDTTFLQQMLTATRNKGAKGECFFFYEALRANNNAIGDFLKAHFYQEPAVLPFRNGKIWRPKAQIVNETDSTVNLVGDWSTYLMKGYEGAILRTSDTLNYASITYNFNVGAAAYYDIYSYRTPNTTWTPDGNYTLYSENDSSYVSVNQSDLSKKGWYKIGTVYLSPGNQKVVKLDNTNLKSGNYLVADAIMLMVNRKLSPDAVLAVRDDKNTQKNIPSNFEVSNNYPNPFNPSTTIKYSINKSAHVKLLVYDILGREVEELVNSQKQAGEYSVRFDANNLSSGVYFYKFQAGQFTKTHKMILLK